MGVLGRYTTYVGGSASDAHKLLSKLFPASAAYPTMQALQGDLPAGNEAAAQKVIQANATAKVDSTGVGGLQPSDGVQQGDLGMFPTGVPLGFGASPDVTTVKWQNPGDPANPYAPDITSPGPGLTDGKDKNVDPKISVQDLQEFSTTEDTAGQDLRVPAADGPAIYSNNTIGSAQKLGDSGGNV